MEQELGISVSFAYVTSKTTKKIIYISCKVIAWPGADPGIQVRGEGALKKIARKLLGYFVWKITILRKKIIFFPILGCPPPLLDPPLMMSFWWGSCCSVFVFCVVFYTSLFVLFCWPLFCLSFELRLLITTLVSSKLFFLNVSRHLHMVVFSMVCLSTSNITIRVKLSTTYWIDWLIFGVLTPLSIIFQLYHGDQF